MSSIGGIHRKILYFCVVACGDGGIECLGDDSALYVLKSAPNSKNKLIS